MAGGRRALEGKVAIVTGGGTGLGKAMALALAGVGADIVVAARRLEPIEQTAREIASLGNRSLAIPTDISDSRQVDLLVERTLAEMGAIDILINNATGGGGGRGKPIWEITDEEWHRGMNTLTGPFYCCRAVGRYLVERKKGKVINLASGWGLRGGRDVYMYSMAKAGVIQLTRTLAITWAPHNIQVNCIAPGFIDVSQWQPVPGNPWGDGTPADSRARYIPVGRVGAPPDIASLSLFLVSDAADYITGGVFSADGGALAGGYAPTGYTPHIGLEEE